MVTAVTNKYTGSPSCGIISPHSTCHVTIQMKAQQEAFPNIKCKDLFHILSTVVSAGTTKEDINSNMFHKESGNVIEECNLSVVFVAPPKPKLLIIETREIKFLFELNKEVSCYLQLPNNTDNYVAFTFMVTGKRKYSGTPNRGVISPHSICHVRLTMQPQREAPPDLLCEDSFDVLSTVVRDGTTEEDINSKMFDRESGNVVEECNLTIAFVSPPEPKLLIIGPREVKFPFELNKKMSCSLQLPNKTDNYVAFKIRVTGRNEYFSCPHRGVISPQSACTVTFTVQAQQQALPDWQCKDTFSILSTVVTPGTKKEDVNTKMFDKESGNVIEECTLAVAFIPPHPQLLSIEHCEIEFPFELKKKISKSLVLPNKTDKYVAFKVIVTDPLKYCVLPNFGVISPHSTSSVTFTMQAQGEAPPDMECKDKFLIRSSFESDGAILEDVNKQMFDKEYGNLIEEYKLRVVFASPPEPPSAVPEKTEEIISKLIKEKNSAVEQAYKLRGKLEILSHERHRSCIVCRIRSQWFSLKSWRNKEAKFNSGGYDTHRGRINNMRVTSELLLHLSSNMLMFVLRFFIYLFYLFIF